MCITIKEVETVVENSFEKNNILRDKNLEFRLAPFQALITSLKEHKEEKKEEDLERKDLQKWMSRFAVTNVSVLIAIGIWVGVTNTKIDNNRERLDIRTEDRFYRQDGEVLSGRIDSLQQNQDKYDYQLENINLKLDKLIELN